MRIASAEIFRVARGRFLAIGGNQLREREEQRGLRQTIAVDTVVAGFRPRILEIAEREAFLLVLRNRSRVARQEFGSLPSLKIT